MKPSNFQMIFNKVNIELSEKVYTESVKYMLLAIEKYFICKYLTK